MGGEEWGKQGREGQIGVWGSGGEWASRGERVRLVGLGDSRASKQGRGVQLLVVGVGWGQQGKLGGRGVAACDGGRRVRASWGWRDGGGFIV